MIMTITMIKMMTVICNSKQKLNGSFFLILAPLGTISFLGYDNHNENQTARNITIFFRVSCDGGFNGNHYNGC